MNKMSKKFITWEEMDRVVEDLAEKIRKTKHKYSAIYFVPRGGAIPAVMLSHKLNLPFTHLPIDENILIVDEIVDGGKTLLFHKKICSKSSKFASCYVKECTIEKPDFFVEEIPKNIWLVFPWETEKTSRRDNK